MRLHTLIPALLALTACDALPKFSPDEGNAVVAKAPASFKLYHENHVLDISIGSLVATNYPSQGAREYDVTEYKAPYSIATNYPSQGAREYDVTEYKAPYSIATSRPFLFFEDVVLTCNVYDGDKVLAGGAGFVIDRAPTGGIIEFKLARAITEGHIDCFAANGKDFTGKTFP